MTKFQISKTAQKKMAKLNLSVREINLALNTGMKIHCTDAVLFFLGKSNLPEGKEFERLNGLTIISKNQLIITVYRNRKVLSAIKNKPKRNNWKNVQGRGKPSFDFCPFHPTFDFCECGLDMGLAA